MATSPSWPSWRRRLAAADSDGTLRLTAEGLARADAIGPWLFSAAVRRDGRPTSCDEARYPVSRTARELQLRLRLLPVCQAQGLRAALAADRAAWRRFVDWARAQPATDQLGVLVTPWGEALIRRWYQDGLAELSRLPQITRAAVQTNLSAPLDWIAAADPIAPRAVVHATTRRGPRSRRSSPRAATARRRRRAATASASSASASITPRPRARCAPPLPAEIYVWINAVKAIAYAADEIAAWQAIDPLFALNLPALAEPGPARAAPASERSPSTATARCGAATSSRSRSATSTTPAGAPRWCRARARNRLPLPHRLRPPRLPRARQGVRDRPARASAGARGAPRAGLRLPIVGCAIAAAGSASRRRRGHRGTRFGRRSPNALPSITRCAANPGSNIRSTPTWNAPLARWTARQLAIAASHAAAATAARSAVEVAAQPAEVQVGDRVGRCRAPRRTPARRRSRARAVEVAAREPGLGDRALDLRALAEQEAERAIEPAARPVDPLDPPACCSARRRCPRPWSSRARPLARWTNTARHAAEPDGQLDEHARPAGAAHPRAQLVRIADIVAGQRVGHRDAERAPLARGGALVEQLGDRGHGGWTTRSSGRRGAIAAVDLVEHGENPRCCWRGYRIRPRSQGIAASAAASIAGQPPVARAAASPRRINARSTSSSSPTSRSAGSRRRARARSGAPVPRAPISSRHAITRAAG